MKKISAMFLAAAVFSAALTGCGANETVVPTQQPQSSAESQRETETETETQSNSGQLTLEDIRQLNGGDIRYSTDGQGKITFLAGKFYDGKIEDGEDVLRALEGVSALIGADDNVAFQKGDAVVDDNGYTYYTLQQWHGDTEVVGSIVKIIVDPDKEAAAISSSVQPGVDAGTDLVISPEEAVEAARTHLAQTMPETAYTFYPEQVDKTTIPYAENMEEDTTKLYNVYVVYTDNPDAAVEETDFPYMAHYISSQGTYLYETPIFRMNSKEAESGGDSQRIFEGKTALTYTGNVTMHDGSTQEISVPILFDETDKVYYLADAQRKIIVADYWEFIHNGGNLQFSSGEENGGWDNNQLLAYANYIKIYDFFNDIGWSSTDGRGTPILLLSDMCDIDKNLEDNACYMGKLFGWSCFGFSSANNYAECVDTMAHEYTHGVTSAMMTNLIYENETGAINEAMSDIMGNIAEMLLGATDDTTWRIYEQGGQAIRCMSDPNAYGQPAYIGDIYYGPEPAEPNSGNDRGGVHVNNSILATIPPILEDEGMTLEEQRLLWITAICALTPKSGYKEFYEILSNAAKITGLDRYQDLIDETFEKLGIIGENVGKPAALKEGCGRFSFEADPSAGRYQAVQIIIFAGDGSGDRVCVTWADKNNEVSSQLFEGDYYIRLAAVDPATGEKGRFYYTAHGWSQEAEAEIPVSIPAGEDVELMDFED